VERKRHPGLFVQCQPHPGGVRVIIWTDVPEGEGARDDGRGTFCASPPASTVGAINLHPPDLKRHKKWGDAVCKTSPTEGFV
jgi:hypothetical protein